jgi:endo-1,3(4)-beta-glucanase
MTVPHRTALGVILGLVVLLGVFMIFSERLFPKKLPLDDTPVSYERAIPVRTNTWFSSLYHRFPTLPLYVFPGSYQVTTGGLSVSASTVTASPNTFFGPFAELCLLGADQNINGIEVVRYGDWDVSVRAKASDQTAFSAHFMQGSPLVLIEDFIGDMTVSCPLGTATSFRSGTLLVTRGTERLLIQAKDPMIADTRDMMTLRSTVGTYRVIQLPSDATNLDFFADLPWQKVIDTRLGWSGSDGRLLTLDIVTEDGQPTLSTLWPHQRLAGVTLPGTPLGTYDTIYGRLELRSLSQLTIPAGSALPETFVAVETPAYREQIREAIKRDTHRLLLETPPTGVYFRGTWLGGLASLTELATLYDMPEERAVLGQWLEKHLTESLAQFVYDEERHMMVARNQEFGNEKGNDHHFHYAYYLRAGATLLTLRPQLRSKLMAPLSELAADIATTSHASARYPFLRHFAPYAGHSFADGEALFADGNNQESSSEALQAWYAIARFGTVIGDEGLTRTGETLFAYELAGTRAYWFGEGNPFPEGYQHHLVSLVWGGKRDYATWFSGQAMHIHGIQWLPITPASGYLGTLPNFAERQAEILRAHPNPATHEWGDLYTAMLSYTDPREAEALLPEAVEHLAMKSTALLYQTVYQNLERQQ